MIKWSPSRNHRSKGIKIKHVLQIILLLGVCFWLIYQVKHSRDKKKEFDENDAEVLVGTQTAYQLPKPGRKDLHPGKDVVNQNEEDEEEVEDENIVEDDENMHEHNEQEERGNRHETEEKEGSKHGVRRGGGEQEEDERRGGDDEIDENDPEKPEIDTGHNEEFMDEEKEKEEDNKNSEHEETGGSVENHNAHEAREEHYMGDDASSAVTHDIHTSSTETETVGLENSDVKSEMSIMKSENKPNYTEESSMNQTGLDFMVTKVELTSETSNATSGKKTVNNNLSNPVYSSHLNNTATAYSDSHSEASSNLPVVIPGASNNMTGTGANTSSEQNKMVIFSESNQAQNDTVNGTFTGDVKNVQTEGLEQGGNRLSEENMRDSNSSVLVKIENGDAAAGESSNREGGESGNTTRFVASNETENQGSTEMSETNKSQNNSYAKEKANAIVKFKGATQTDEIDETSDSSSRNGTSDSVERHATNSSDSHVLKDVTEVRTDLDTLPNIRNEGHNGDQTATE